MSSNGLLFALWDQETVALAGLLDARHITAVRTAATSAVAVDRLCSEDTIHVAVLGSSTEAAAHVQAVAAVRKMKSLAVFSPTGKHRKDFAARFAEELGISCSAVDSARAAVSNADLVIAAARSSLQDIAVAEMCLEKARQRGLGTPLPVGLSIKGRKLRLPESP